MVHNAIGLTLPPSDSDEAPSQLDELQPTLSCQQFQALAYGLIRVRSASGFKPVDGGGGVCHLSEAQDEVRRPCETGCEIYPLSSWAFGPDEMRSSSFRLQGPVPSSARCSKYSFLTRQERELGKSCESKAGSQWAKARAASGFHVVTTLSTKSV